MRFRSSSVLAFVGMGEVTWDILAIMPALASSPEASRGGSAHGRARVVADPSSCVLLVGINIAGRHGVPMIHRCECCSFQTCSGDDVQPAEPASGRGTALSRQATGTLLASGRQRKPRPTVDQARSVIGTRHSVGNSHYITREAGRRATWFVHSPSTSRVELKV